jgi:hypothetical protein
MAFRVNGPTLVIAAGAEGPMCEPISLAVWLSPSRAFRKSDASRRSCLRKQASGPHAPRRLDSRWRGNDARPQGLTGHICNGHLDVCCKTPWKFATKDLTFSTPGDSDHAWTNLLQGGVL